MMNNLRIINTDPAIHQTWPSSQNCVYAYFQKHEFHPSQPANTLRCFYSWKTSGKNADKNPNECSREMLGLILLAFYHWPIPFVCCIPIFFLHFYFTIFFFAILKWFCCCLLLVAGLPIGSPAKRYFVLLAEHGSAHNCYRVSL